MVFKKTILLFLLLLPPTAWCKTFHSSIGLCKAARAELEPELLQKEIDTVKSDFFCAGNTFPVPNREWECKPQEKAAAFCRKTYWECSREYTCITEEGQRTRKLALKTLEEHRAGGEPIFQTKEPAETTAEKPRADMHQGACRALSAKIQSCESFQCREPHPLMRGFTVEHTLAGMKGDRCVYTQTMPNGGRMDCRFKEESLPKMAMLLKEGESSKNPLNDALTSGECQISGYGE